MLSSFAADDGPFLAGAVAYQLFFALVPLLALVIGLLGFVYGTARAEAELTSIVRGVYPSATGEETKLIHQLVEGRALSLGIGLVGTMLSVTAILGSIDTAISHVLGREGKRALVRDRLNGFAFIGLLILLAVGSFALSYGVQVAAGALGSDQLAVRIAVRIISPLVGLGVGYFFFYLVFRLAPRRAVARRDARLAALVSAVLWEVAKVGFGLLTTGLGIFAAYGALAFAAGLLTWTYLTAVIILIGAEVVKTRHA